MVSEISHGIGALEKGEVTTPPAKKGTPISLTLTTVRGPWDCSLELLLNGTGPASSLSLCVTKGRGVGPHLPVSISKNNWEREHFAVRTHS